MTSSSLGIIGTYNAGLVVLSVLVAILSAGGALDLTGRVTQTQGIARCAWLCCGALVMGLGIWSMHYIGMLAYDLPMTVRYDWPTVILSLAAAVFASWVSLFVASRSSLGWARAVSGSVVMGAGITLMHYIGMEAMRLPAMCHYSVRIVALSFVLAVVVSYVALLLTFAFRESVVWGPRKVLSALVMGSAIPLMHYVGMAAVSFVPMPLDSTALAHAINISDLGIISITLVTLVCLAIVFITSAVDRRFAVQAQVLRSAELRFRQIVETAMDAFLEFDSNGVLTDWNTHAEEIFGWSRAEAIGKTINDFILLEGHGQAVRDLRSMFDKTTSQAMPKRIELIARRRDGQEFPAEMVISAFQWGTKHFFAVFLHDVTMRALAELDRESAKLAAESGNRAKSEFLANMSHEIRTPMNGVIGMAELLLDTGLNPLQRDYTEIIRDSGTALLKVINDILDFSKIEAGKLEIEILDMDLRSTFEDVARLLSIQAHKKDLELTVQIDSRLPELVRGDVGRLRQILLNLATNAVKFTAKGEVSLALMVIETSADSTRVRFEVRDTGIGIPAERLSVLYDPFVQVDCTTTRRFGGTGLGLSIVRRLVELMGGETGVTSAEGVGSVFWFTALFPHALDQRRQLPAAVSSRQGLRILVVDDNATNREVLKGQLLVCGLECVLANSAAQALEYMREAIATGRPFEAALLDHQMPVCDGAELGRIINRDELMSVTRLILLTSSGQRSDEEKFADIGFAGYLMKPVTRRDLTDLLLLILDKPATVWHMRSQPIVTREALRSTRSARPRRLLLAEDNLVNQKVAQRLLETLGHRVEIAADGEAAVAAWKTGEFELILMDCQMPVLDGYEATRQIRMLEDGGSRIPIVALTAHAMKGDSEKCFAAGMDDHLTKPIERVKLEACLEHFLPSTVLAAESTVAEQYSKTTADDATQVAAPAVASPVDWTALLESIDGDADFARALVGIFVTSGDHALATIATSLTDCDYVAMRQLAHSLKGACANVYAPATTRAASQLEEACTNNHANIPLLVDNLRIELGRTMGYLQLKVA
jgi:two-component system, sensor histidine kinase and response regulator